MTNDELIAAARARLAEHGACSDVMKEMKALIEALDEEKKSQQWWEDECHMLAGTSIANLNRNGES